MNLYQYDEGYRYNSDSLLLYDFISKLNPKGKLLDVGSGCGILGLLLKRDFPSLELTQIDIQEQNIVLTKKNALENSLDSKVLQGDFLHVDFEDRFDVIVSNPPFYDKGSKKSENISLMISRYNENLPIEEFTKKVSSSLGPRGSFIFCYDAKQLDSLLFYLYVNKFNVEDIRFIHTKPDKISNLVLIHAKKSSKSLLKVHPPLFIHDANGVRNKEVEKIYEKSQTMSKIWPN